MITGDEIRRALEGAFILARLDVSGLERFDVSVDGFWKSFAAALLVAPAYAVLIAEQYVMRGSEAPLGSILTVELLSFVATVIAFPIVAIVLTRLLGLGGRYVPLVVAANWSTVPQITLVLAALVLANVVPGARGALFGAATIAAMIYSWFVIRTALGTTGMIAFGLLVVDVILSLSIDAATDRLLPLPLPPPS